MRFRVGWAALAVLLFLATPVMAANGSFTGHAATPVTIEGDRHATASDASFLVAGPEGQVSLLLQGAEGKATRVIQRAFGIVSSSDPHAEVLWPQEVERVPLDLSGGLLSLESREATFQLLVDQADADLSTGATPQALSVGISAKDRIVTEQLQPPLSVKIGAAAQPFRERIPKGLYESAAADGHLTADGSMRIFLSGATVLWHPSQGEAQRFQAFFHKETRDGTVYNPLTRTWTGGGSHDEYVQEYIVVEALSGHLDVQFTGVAGSLFAAHPSYAVDGRAVLPAMQGAVAIREDGKETETLHPVRGEALTLAGRFTLRPHTPDRDGHGTRVAGEGDFTIVSYGAVDARYDWASTAVAVGLGAVALAALAWIGANGKAIAGSLGGGLLAGYARVHGGEVLEHPGRAEVYERVKAFPGVNFVQLSQQVQFGASTLNYHLRVLEKNGYIASVRDGRYLRFFDRTCGAYAGTRKMAVSALRNETSAAMAKHIRDHPGVAQCDLAAAFKVTPSTVTWHINRLAGQGLVQKARDGAHTRYYLGEGWASLPLEERVRQEGEPAAVVVA